MLKIIKAVSVTDGRIFYLIDRQIPMRIASDVIQVSIKVKCVYLKSLEIAPFASRLALTLKGFPI